MKLVLDDGRALRAHDEDGHGWRSRDGRWVPVQDTNGPGSGRSRWAADFADLIEHSERVTIRVRHPLQDYQLRLLDTLKATVVVDPERGDPCCGACGYQTCRQERRRRKAAERKAKAAQLSTYDP